MDAYTSLISFWRKYPRNNINGLHPEDAPSIPEEKIVYLNNIKEYIKSDLLGAFWTNRMGFYAVRWAA